MKMDFRRTRSEVKEHNENGTLCVSASLRDRLIRRLHGLAQISFLVSFVLFVVKTISLVVSSSLSFFNKNRLTSYVLRLTSYVFKTLIPGLNLRNLWINKERPHAEPRSRREEKAGGPPALPG